MFQETGGGAVACCYIGVAEKVIEVSRKIQGVKNVKTAVKLGSDRA